MIEGRPVNMTHEFERSTPEVLERSLVHPRPIGSEFLLCGHDRIGEQLQNILAWGADVPPPVPANRSDGPRFHVGRTKIVPQTFENCCAQQPVVSNCAEFDFSINLRFDPRCLRLLDWDG